MSDENPDIISWLENQRPEVWHAVGDCWNWDCGLEPLFWLAQQPKCDGGTVRSIFWTCYLSDPTVASFSPETRHKVEEWCLEEQRLFALIGKNAFNGFYKTNRFKCMNDDTASSWGASVAQDIQSQREQGFIDWSFSDVLLKSGGQALDEDSFSEAEADGIETALVGGFQAQ